VLGFKLMHRDMGPIVRYLGKDVPKKFPLSPLLEVGCLKAGRADASQEQTDAESFDVLEPEADGFRNY
jgi:catalase (peroxidase I)